MKTISATVTINVGEITRTISASTQIDDNVDWVGPLRDLFDELRRQEARGIPDIAED